MGGRVDILIISSHFFPLRSEILAHLRRHAEILSLLLCAAPDKPNQPKRAIGFKKESIFGSQCLRLMSRNSIRLLEFDFRLQQYESFLDNISHATLQHSGLSANLWHILSTRNVLKGIVSTQQTLTLFHCVVLISQMSSLLFMSLNARGCQRGSVKKTDMKKLQSMYVKPVHSQVCIQQTKIRTDLQFNRISLESYTECLFRFFFFFFIKLDCNFEINI